ncbi:MAG: alcohol dehydrogenase, partial [SAR324 cluster bacterium]|nr:alcohol dehydrogenase [SAR324 cluster bacterium]
KSLGTAGALSMLPEKPTRPFIVMNGDLLTKVNFQQLIDFHTHHNAQATMCVREYDFQVPYGVVKIEDEHHRITHISEKPVQRFFVNAGIYVLQPEILSVIPENHYYDMPSLFDRLIQEKQETCAFPIREYWMDIGKLEDLERANGEFNLIFQPDKK